MKPEILSPIRERAQGLSPRVDSKTGLSRRIRPIGSKVKELREERGWTQGDLACVAGLSKSTIEKLEAGKKPFPLKTLKAVAEALKVSIECITTQSRAVIELSLGRRLDPFLEETDSLLHAMKVRLCLVGNPRVIHTPSDGTVVTLEMSKEDCNRLFWAVADRTLDDLSVRGAKLITAVDSDLGRTISAAPNAAFPPTASAESSHSLLIVDDIEAVRNTLKLLLEHHFEIHLAATADAAEDLFRRFRIDLILTDQRLPGRSGVQLLEWVRLHSPRTIRLLMTGYDDIEHTIDAINRGHVYHYFTKPTSAGELLSILRHAAEKIAFEERQEHTLRELRRAYRKERRAKQRLRDRLEREALTDPLTGVFNRRFIEGLARTESQGRIRNPLSIGLIDVDPLSEDSAKDLAARIHKSLREVDWLGRWEGSRFMVIAQAREEGAARLSKRILANTADGTSKLAIGFAVADAGVVASLEAMLEVACDALSLSKQFSGECYEVRPIPRHVPEAV
jgi:DNA-binding NarL/FixJ family response regulator/transcriptional regulator with XRE-family HTH domain